MPSGGVNSGVKSLVNYSSNSGVIFAGVLSRPYGFVSRPRVNRFAGQVRVELRCE